MVKEEKIIYVYDDFPEMNLFCSESLTLAL